MTIGGEHIFSPLIYFRKNKNQFNEMLKSLKNDFSVNLTLGGYHSLLAIIDDLVIKHDKTIEVLLPSYLCNTILIPFKQKKIKYNFYKLNKDLEIDYLSIKEKLNSNVKAILFIDYFGVNNLNLENDIIKEIKNNNIKIIQDRVQCLNFNENFYGDYIFNSFRKFFPFEGSILLTKKPIEIVYSECNNNKFIKFKRKGQILRYFHLKFKIIKSELFLKKFKKAEENYYDGNIYKMSQVNIKMINKYDIREMIFIQKQKFKDLSNNFEKFIPMFLKKETICPLGFIMILENRDFIRKKLFENKIYAPIHWIASEELNTNDFKESIELSEKIITIPISNITIKQFKYLKETLKKIL